MIKEMIEIIEKEGIEIDKKNYQDIVKIVIVIELEIDVVDLVQLMLVIGIEGIIDQSQGLVLLLMIIGQEIDMEDLIDNMNVDLLNVQTLISGLVIEEVNFVLKIENYRRDENRESRKYQRNSPTYERDGR